MVIITFVTVSMVKYLLLFIILLIFKYFFEIFCNYNSIKNKKFKHFLLYNKIIEFLIIYDSNKIFILIILFYFKNFYY